MTDTTWKPPDGKPENMHDWRRRAEIDDWEQLRSSAWDRWFGEHFTDWWTTDARGGIIWADSDDVDKAGSGTVYMTTCKECGSTIFVHADDDDQPYLNAHRAFHDRLRHG